MHLVILAIVNFFFYGEILISVLYVQYQIVLSNKKILVRQRLDIQVPYLYEETDATNNVQQESHSVFY